MSGLFSRLSLLCRCGFPGQADDADFFGCRLVGVSCLKSGGDEDAAELAVHVGGGGLGLFAVPGSPVTVLGHVGGVVSCGGVPGDGEGLAGELEGDGAADRAGEPVAGLPGAEELLGVFYRDSIGHR